MKETTTMFRTRLLRLADFLDELKPARFNYAYIVDIWSWEGQQDLSCGATACALGWAGTIPEFRKQGLYLTPGGALGNTTLEDRESYDSFEVASLFFGLNEDEADYLFLPRGRHPECEDIIAPKSNATAKQVAQHIRRFVLEEKWP